jgi:hypothetical protein
LYEVIAEATSEEHTARRRQGKAPRPYDQLAFPEPEALAAEGEEGACYQPNC